VSLAGYPSYLRLCPNLVDRNRRSGEWHSYIGLWTSTTVGSLIVPEAAFLESGCLSQSVLGEQWWFGRLPATYLFASTFSGDLATCLQSLDSALSSIVFELWPNYTTRALEPLSTHLDSQTYELFERDTAKYDLYERAISAALSQKPDALLAVVGAGRARLSTGLSGRVPSGSLSSRRTHPRANI
jgi:hypothetical protein